MERLGVAVCGLGFAYCRQIAFLLSIRSSRKGGAGAPSALIAYSAVDTEYLRASGIAGALVKVVNR